MECGLELFKALAGWCDLAHSKADYSDREQQDPEGSACTIIMPNATWHTDQQLQVINDSPNVWTQRVFLGVMHAPTW